MQLDWLQFFWQIIYVTNLATGYLTYDFARGYLDVGGFTIRRRLHLAWVFWIGTLRGFSTSFVRFPFYIYYLLRIFFSPN